MEFRPLLELSHAIISELNATSGWPRPGRPAYTCHTLPRNFMKSYLSPRESHTKMGSAKFMS